MLPEAAGRVQHFQDLGHSFSLYGPTLSRQITYLFHHTFYETNFKPKSFTANVECNGTVIKEPKTEKVILFLNLSSRSMVATLCFGSLSTLLTLEILSD